MRKRRGPIYHDPYLTTAPIVGLIYSWTFNPPFPHPLKGCSYFGQTLNSLEMRTRQHKNCANRGKKRFYSFHALWLAYPHDDIWDIRALIRKEFDNRLDAMQWMNGEEVRLIAAHGGIFRSMNYSLKQTLNRKAGGRGDPRKLCEGAVDGKRAHMLDVWGKLREFYDVHKHLHITRTHKQLGSIVHGIRSSKSFLHYADFKEWLIQCDFAFDAHRAQLEKTWVRLKSFHNEHQHLRIPRSHKQLGMLVDSIRFSQSFLYDKQFATWLFSSGFEMRTKDAEKNKQIWEDVFARQQAHSADLTPRTTLPDGNRSIPTMQSPHDATMVSNTKPMELKELVAHAERACETANDVEKNQMRLKVVFAQYLYQAQAYACVPTPDETRFIPTMQSHYDATTAPQTEPMELVTHAELERGTVNELGEKHTDAVAKSLLSGVSKYAKFTESQPIDKRLRNGLVKKAVGITCNECAQVFTHIMVDHLRSSKASRCKQHLDHECVKNPNRRDKAAKRTKDADANFVDPKRANTACQISAMNVVVGQLIYQSTPIAHIHALLHSAPVPK